MTSIHQHETYQQGGFDAVAEYSYYKGHKNSLCDDHKNNRRQQNIHMAE